MGPADAVAADPCTFRIPASGPDPTPARGGARKREDRRATGTDLCYMFGRQVVYLREVARFGTERFRRAAMPP